MHFRHWLFALGFGLASLGTLACGSEDDEDDGASDAELERKCDEMCENLLAPPLAGCGKSDASDQATCVAECFDHVTPDEDGELEATEGELDCAVDAPDCTAWEACGDFL